VDSAAIMKTLMDYLASPSDANGEGAGGWLDGGGDPSHTPSDVHELYSPTSAPTTGDDYSMQKIYICLLFNLVSWTCSTGMIIVYFCQKSRAPRLLLWLFVGNFVFFSAMTTLYLYRIEHEEPLKDGSTACTVVSSFELFGLVFSMLWPSVICFDLLQSTRDPKWRWEGEFKVERIYLVVVSTVAGLAVFGALFRNDNGGCQVTQYDAPGDGQIIPEIISVYLPIAAFVFNVVVLLLVRRSLGRELPFSVRTRRRKQLVNYVVVWLLCWGPWVLNSFFHSEWSNMGKKSLSDFYFFRNLFLYSTGFLNLTLVGVQNAWLKRGLRIACDRLNLASCCGLGTVENELLRSPTEKVVKFPPELSDRLPRYGSKYYVMRCRLTREEKYALYLERPDLDMSQPLEYESEIVIDDFMAQGMEAQEFGVVRGRPEDDSEYKANGNPQAQGEGAMSVDVEAGHGVSASPDTHSSSSSLSARQPSDDKMSEASQLSDMGVAHDDSLTAPLMPTTNACRSSNEPNSSRRDEKRYEAPASLGMLPEAGTEAAEEDSLLPSGEAGVGPPSS